MMSTKVISNGCKFRKFCILTLLFILVMFLQDSTLITDSGQHQITQNAVNTFIDDTSTNQTNETSLNYSMNNLWRSRKRKYTVIYISDQCKFIYFTTLKTASFTSRAMIDRTDCGFGVDLFGNMSWRKTCGDHACNNKDFKKLSNENHKYFTILFTRNPIERFESSYNFMYGYVPMRAQKRFYYKPLNITIDDVDENIPGLYQLQKWNI